MYNSSYDKLDIVVARRIDRAYSRIRRGSLTLRRLLMPPRDLDRYYQLLGKVRKQVYDFASLLVETLKNAGYQAYTHSNSHWLMIDTQVRVDIEEYTFMVWSFNKKQYTVFLESAGYCDYPVGMHPFTEVAPNDFTRPTIVIYTVQKLIITLYTMQVVVRDYKKAMAECRQCHYSSEDGYYCGRGLVPTGSCTHYLHNNKDSYYQQSPCATYQGSSTTSSTASS